MKNYMGGVVHLSINHEGRLSLWDSASGAISGKEPHEVVLQLSLTVEQIRKIAQAERFSMDKKRELDAGQ